MRAICPGVCGHPSLYKQLHVFATTDEEVAGTHLVGGKTDSEAWLPDSKNTLSVQPDWVLGFQDFTLST